MLVFFNLLLSLQDSPVTTNTHLSAVNLLTTLTSPAIFFFILQQKSNKLKKKTYVDNTFWHFLTRERHHLPYCKKYTQMCIYCTYIFYIQILKAKFIFKNNIHRISEDTSMILLVTVNCAVSSRMCSLLFLLLKVNMLCRSSTVYLGMRTSLIS